MNIEQHSTCFLQGAPILCIRLCKNARVSVADLYDTTIVPFCIVQDLLSIFPMSTLDVVQPVCSFIMFLYIHCLCLICADRANVIYVNSTEQQRGKIF